MIKAVIEVLKKNPVADAGIVLNGFSFYIQVFIPPFNWFFDVIGVLNIAGIVYLTYSLVKEIDRVHQKHTASL